MRHARTPSAVIPNSPSRIVIHNGVGRSGLRGAASVAVFVVTVTFTFCALDPLNVTELGLTVQVASEGAPVQASVMA